MFMLEIQLKGRVLAYSMHSALGLVPSTRHSFMHLKVCITD